MRCKFRFNPYTWSFLASASAFGAVLAWAGASGADTSAKTRPALEQQFTGTIRPFMQTYCVPVMAKRNHRRSSTSPPTGAWRLWRRIFPTGPSCRKNSTPNRCRPRRAKQPSDSQRSAVSAWVRAVRLAEAARNAGDPGPVLARRLSNAEYDYTIRDLTGVDMRPTREFPVDPANQEGFDNSGELLTLSPALMKKYVQAAKGVADNMALTTNGLAFASHPVLAETDRDKFCILRIVDFYKRQPTDIADYFQAAWRYRHRAALGAPNATLQTVAAQTKVSPRYLEPVWNTLNAPGEKVGPCRQTSDAMERVARSRKGQDAKTRMRHMRAAWRCGIGLWGCARKWRGSSPTFGFRAGFPPEASVSCCGRIVSTPPIAVCLIRAHCSLEAFLPRG